GVGRSNRLARSSRTKQRPAGDGGPLSFRKGVSGGWNLDLSAAICLAVPTANREVAMIRLRTALLLAAAGASLTACAYNEALGRSQFLIVGNASMTHQSY